MADSSENVTAQAAKKPYHHGDLRAVLIDATRDLVEQKGAAHFSVAQAARLAGVSSAAPYRHFKDREDMLDAVARDGLTRLAQSFEVATAPFEVGTIDAITAMGLAYIEFATQQPAVFRLMFSELQNHSAEVERAGDCCKVFLIGQVGAHLGAPGYHEDLHPEAFPLWALVHGIAFLTIDGKVGSSGLDLPIETILRAATERLLSR